MSMQKPSESALLAISQQVADAPAPTEHQRDVIALAFPAPQWIGGPQCQHASRDQRGGR